MKKYIFGIGITTLIIFALVLFVSAKKGGGPTEKNLLGAQITISATEQKIKENIEKYQPKASNVTKESGLDLSAKSAILVDETSGEILYQKSPHEILSPASITKVATLAVALENLGKDDLLTVSENAASQEPNKIVMSAGEKMKAEDLYYGLMMISANDAAWVIAESVDGGFEAFIKKMNEKAKSLGLRDTNFVNPSGFDDPKHRTSVFDIATFVRYDLKEHPEFVQYTGHKEEFSVFPTDHNESHWWSHISHMLYAYPGMIAAKTGYTDIAKSTFAGVAERNGRRITVVFMASTDANGDVKKLLDFGFAQK